MNIYSCAKCGFSHSEFTGRMHFGDLHDWSLKEAKFRRIVKKAMIAEDIIIIDDQLAFINWLIGPDYGEIPYMIQNKEEIYRQTKEIPEDWISRIQTRGKLVNVGPRSSVYDVIRAAAQIYKSKRILVGMN